MTYSPKSAIPWPTDHITSNTDWAATWPELRNNEVDPIQVVADLYLPEGLACHGFVKGFDELPVSTAGDKQLIVGTYEVEQLAKTLRISDIPAAIERRTKTIEGLGVKPTGHREKLDEIADRARSYQATLVDAVFPTFWAYAHAACGGELRHHPTICGTTLPGNRKAAWVQWRAIFEQFGTDALKLMEKLFREMKGGGIGGKRWADAAKCILLYEEGKLGPTPESNRKMFLDRALALQHNGGCFFSKRTWANHRNGILDKLSGGFTAQALYPNHQSMVPILDAHAANPVRVEDLYTCASPFVRRMTIEYFKVAKEAGLELNVDWDYDVERQFMTPEYQGLETTGLAWRITKPEDLPKPSIPVKGTPNDTTMNVVVDTPTGLDAILKNPKGFKMTLTLTKLYNPDTGAYFDAMPGPIHIVTYSFKNLEELLGKKVYFAHLTKTCKPDNGPWHIREMSIQFSDKKGKTVSEVGSYTGTNWTPGKSKMGEWFINKCNI